MSSFFGLTQFDFTRIEAQIRGFWQSKTHIIEMIMRALVARLFFITNQSVNNVHSVPVYANLKTSQKWLVFHLGDSNVDLSRKCRC